MCPVPRAVGVNDAAKSANPNKANALYAILFEAVSLATTVDSDGKLLTLAVTVLGKFLANKVCGADCVDCVGVMG